MAYTALYRKWRAALFEGVRGQEHIVRTWKNQIIADLSLIHICFVKYRYIVCAKVTQGRYELWVPGNYEKSEELMAQMFGFYCFRSVKSKKASAGDFGYWLSLIHISSLCCKRCPQFEGTCLSYGGVLWIFEEAYGATLHKSYYER